VSLPADGVTLRTTGWWWYRLTHRIVTRLGPFVVLPGYAVSAEYSLPVEDESGMLTNLAPP
jgi:hypothetical protein